MKSSVARFISKMFIVSHSEYRYLGGPSDGRLLPRDQILSVNGVDVRHENKLGVVEMIRKSTTVLRLEVAQPPRKVRTHFNGTINFNEIFS